MVVRRSARFRRLARLTDDLVEAFAPRAARRRMRARIDIEHGRPLLSAMQSLGVGGPRFDSRTVTAGAGTLDANAAILPDLDQIRAKVRDSALHNPLYRAVRGSLVNFVCGRTGVTPRSQIDVEALARAGVPTTPDDITRLQGAIDEAWRLATRVPDASERSKSWGAMQRAAFRAMFDGGDVGVAFPVISGHSRVLLIEAERIATPPDRAADPTVRSGVQLGKWNQPVGFHVLRFHPGDALPKRASLEHQFFPTTRGVRVNMMQLLTEDRLGAARGVPPLAQAIPLLDQVASYTNSTVITAELQTRLSYFIQTNADEAWENDDGGSRPAQGYADFQDRVEAGEAVVLNRGDEIKAVGLTAPQPFTDQLIIRLLRIIAASVGVPHSVASLDNAGANFSSMRAEREVFRQVIAVLQDEILMPMAQAYWHNIVLEAWLNGLILPTEIRFNFADPVLREIMLGAVWSRPIVPSVDPIKDAQADIALVQARLKAPQEVITARGADPREVQRQIIEWERVQREAGIVVTMPGSATLLEDEEDEEGEQQDEEETEDEDRDEEDELEEAASQGGSR